ncbi:hypothetical protein [Eikenella sp. Marseille-P7795]|nr:hypothetical protein [Eikenella sp. Marseille-P7795]
MACGGAFCWQCPQGKPEDDTLAHSGQRRRASSRRACKSAVQAAHKA